MFVLSVIMWYPSLHGQFRVQDFGFFFLIRQRCANTTREFSEQKSRAGTGCNSLTRKRYQIQVFENYRCRKWQYRTRRPVRNEPNHAHTYTRMHHNGRILCIIYRWQYVHNMDTQKHTLKCQEWPLRSKTVLWRIFEVGDLPKESYSPFTTCASEHP